MKIGYDGDHASYADISGFIKIGIPTIIYSLVDTPEGREAMADILRDLLASYEAENGGERRDSFTVSLFYRD